MKIKNNQVICFGEVLWDRLPGGDQPGGAPMNVAVHLNNFGVNVDIVSKVGTEESGKNLLQFLKKRGLNTPLIQTDSTHSTSEVLVRLDDNNNATYEICEPVAWDFIEFTPELREKANRAGLVIFGTLASRNAVTRQTLFNLLEYLPLKLMDVNFRKPFISKEITEILLEKSNIVKLNQEELLLIAHWHNQKNSCKNDLLKWFAEIYKLQMVCLTLGKNGALLYSQGRIFSHPGFFVNTVDTVGAGDAFLAGLVVSLLDDKKPEDALAFACATGAFVASKAGATPAYQQHEIVQILNSAN